MPTFFDRLLGRGGSQAATKTIPEPVREYLLSDSTTGFIGQAPMVENETLYKEVSWHYACMTRRALGVSSMPYEFQRQKYGRGKGNEFIPNLEFAVKRTLYLVELDWLTYGESYLLAIANRAGVVRKIRHIIQKGIKPERRNFGMNHENVLVRNTDSGAQVYRKMDGVWTCQWGKETLTLIHLKSPSHLTEGGAGVPDSRPAFVDSNVMRFIGIHLADHFGSGAVNKMVATAETMPYDVEEKRRLKSYLNRIMRGIDRTAEIEILSNGIKLENITSSIKELTIPQIEETKQEDICVAFATPRAIIVGDMTNRGDDDNLYLSWLDTVIIPRTEFIIDQINDALLYLTGYRLVIHPSLLPVMQAREEKRSKHFGQLVQAGVNPDTAAVIAGVNVPEGYTLTGGRIVEGAADNQAAATGATGGEATDSQNVANETRALHTWAKKRVKAGKSLDGFTPEHLTTEQVGDILSPYKGEGDATLDAAFFTKATGAVQAIMGMEKTMTLAMLPALTAIPRRVVDALESNGAWEPIVIEQMQRFGNLWTEQTTKAARRGIADGKRFTDGLNKKAVKEYEDIDWTLPNEEAAAWAEANTARYLTNMTEEMALAMAADIAEWIRTGQAIYTLIDHWAATYEFSRDRMDAIATTEITRAYAYGNQAAWQTSGVVWGKQWVTANDERVCPICAPLGGLTFGEEAVPATIDQQNQSAAVSPLGSSFIHPGGNGAAADYAGTEYELPPAHVRCRCTIAPIVTQPE